MMVSMLVTQRMTPQTGMDPTQQKMMTWMMPLMMGFIFFNLAAGLNLYYAESNLIMIAQQAVMAVAGVGIESDVAEYPDLRHSLLDGPDGTTHQIVRIERLASVLVTALRVGIGKERETGNGKLGGALGLSHGLIDRETLDARHRVDRHARLRSFGEEQRPNQIMRGQCVLAHEAPRPLRLAVAARALGEIETGLALDLGLDGGETGFDGTAVFDGHL